MKLSPEEKARLVNMRARLILAVEEFVRSKQSFDDVTAALKKLHDINDEWTILWSSQTHQIFEGVSNSHIKLFSLFVAGKKIASLNTQYNAVMFDQDTRTALSVLFKNSPVVGLSAPVAHSTQLFMGDEHVQTIDDQKYYGVVSTLYNTSYSIEFADHTKLQWKLQDATVDMAQIRQQYDDKIHELSPAPQNRLG